MNQELCVLYGEPLITYGFEDPHPFGKKRLPAFWKEFQKRGLQQKCKVENPEICDETVLMLFHTFDYVRLVASASTKGEGYLDYGDTPAYPGIFEAARWVVGTTLKAVRLVMESRYKRAFTPLGGLHHARRHGAGGFCVFNDVGIAIEYLRTQYHVRRIGYVDIDAHHGDGVYYSYEADPEVFIADIHEDGRFLYPGTGFAEETGKGPAEGTKLNLPLPPGSGEEDFLEAFHRVETFLRSCEPEIILFQCGADSAAGDPLADLMFPSRCHAHAAARLKILADQTAAGRLIAMGGGGYDLNNLANVWCDVIQVLL